MTSTEVPGRAETPVDPAEYLDGVRALLPALRERARATEQLGRIPDETVRDLDGAGVFRGLQPRRWGGLELDPVTYFESVVLIASACAATGWVAGVLGVHPWEIALLPEEAQADVWARDPLIRASSSYAPTGTVHRVTGGFELSGTWRFSSGVDLCDWTILGGFPEGEPPSTEMRAFLVPHHDLRIDHGSWQVAGLAGTGSKSVTLQSAFVPEYRSHRMLDVDEGRVPGWEVNRGPLYRLPWMDGVFAYGIAAPAIGAALGALDAFVQQSRTRVGAYGGAPVAQNAGLHKRLANAMAEVDAARLLMRATWDEQFRRVSAGDAITAEARTRCRYQAARTITNCMYAVLEVFEVAGGGVMHLSNPIQRFLRDILAMKNHPMGAIEYTASVHVREVLGVTRPDPRA